MTDNTGVNWYQSGCVDTINHLKYFMTISTYVGICPLPSYNALKNDNYS